VQPPKQLGNFANISKYLQHKHYTTDFFGCQAVRKKIYQKFAIFAKISYNNFIKRR